MHGSYNPPMERALFGGVAAARFLDRYWQKRSLLVRAALPGFRGLLSWGDLVLLAVRDDVESRLVLRDRGRWTLTHGPFRRRDLQRLPARNWTLLVQGVNLNLAAADALLRRFAFIPDARLDDLMVSYAAPGGGVGPHFDSYDVFLLQGQGRRRWRIGRQRNLTLKAGLPLKILARFRPRHQCILGPGDMLYLPPEVAHDGIALDTCTTYSIGFRAPSAQELATGFLDWLRDRVEMEGRYGDPDLVLERNPARIPRDLQTYARDIVSRLNWNAPEIAQFLGAHLTEPKPSVAFAPRAGGRALSACGFAARASRRGVRLDRATQLLYDATHIFINGDVVEPPANAKPALRRLADARELTPGRFDREALKLLYRWYHDGFLHFR
jgi:50S ribosomal protein L16 3-hydroxylase